MQTLEEIKIDCKAEIEAFFTNSIKYYLQHYPAERKIYAEEFKKACCILMDKIDHEIIQLDIELFNTDGKPVYTIENADYAILKTDVGREIFCRYCEEEQLTYEDIPQEDNYTYFYYDYVLNRWRNYKPLHNKVAKIDKIFGLEREEI